MTNRERLSHTILAMLCGIATITIGNIALTPWINLDWRSPIQQWMIANGASGLVEYFSLLYLVIPTYITVIIGGGIIGVIAWKRWWQFSLVYSGTIIVFPYLFIMMFIGSLSSVLSNKTSIVVTELLLHSTIIPLVLVSAYKTSNSRKRRHIRCEFQICIHCSYNLTGNESGVCPECGTEIKP